MKILLLICVCLSLNCYAAQSDDAEVHALAHFGAGVLVADVMSLGLHGLQKSAPLYCSILTIAASYEITDLYEQLTHKSETVRLQHDLAGALGGVNVSLTLNF